MLMEIKIAIYEKEVVETNGIAIARIKGEKKGSGGWIFGNCDYGIDIITTHNGKTFRWYNGLDKFDPWMIQDHITMAMSRIRKWMQGQGNQE